MMYINRVRTMKAKSSLRRYIRLDLVRVMILMMLSILLMDCVWGHYQDQINSHAQIVQINQPMDSEVQQPLKLTTIPKNVTDDQIVGDSHSMMVDRTEFAEQLAMFILVNHQHEITDYRVSFLRDPKKSGSEFKQFAAIFGREIDQGISGHDLNHPDQQEMLTKSVQ